jgi:Nuf2 family
MLFYHMWVLLASSRVQIPMVIYSGRIAKMAKVKVFQARDLTRPDGPRTIRILSAIVNFKAFSDTDERITWLHELRTRYEKSLHRYSTVCDELEQLEQELEEERYIYWRPFASSLLNHDCIGFLVTQKSRLLGW